MWTAEGFTAVTCGGFSFWRAAQYENLQLALILMHSYQLSGFINKCGRVSSGVDHLHQSHFAQKSALRRAL